jgi:hypothetical protein
MWDRLSETSLKTVQRICMNILTGEPKFRRLSKKSKVLMSALCDVDGVLLDTVAIAFEMMGFEETLEYYEFIETPESLEIVSDMLFDLDDHFRRIEIKHSATFVPISRRPPALITKINESNSQMDEIRAIRKANYGPSSKT